MRTPLTLTLIAGIIMAMLLWRQYQPSLRLRITEGHLTVSISWWRYFEQQAITGDSMWFRERAIRQFKI